MSAHRMKLRHMGRGRRGRKGVGRLGVGARNEHTQSSPEKGDVTRGAPPSALENGTHISPMACFTERMSAARSACGGTGACV